MDSQITTLKQTSNIIDENSQKIYRKLIITRFLSANFFVFLLQLIGTVLSYALPFQPLSAATGTAFAYLYLRGIRILPGLLMASFLIPLFITRQYTISLLFTLKTFFISYGLLLLLYRFTNPSLIFNKIWHWLRFFILASAICFLSNLLNYNSGIEWLIDLNGILVISLAIVTIDAYFPDIKELHRLKTRIHLHLYGIMFFLCLLQVFFVNIHLALVIASLNMLIYLYLCYKNGWCGCMSALCLQGIVYQLAALLNAPAFMSPYYVLIASSITLNALLGLSLSLYTSTYRFD